MKKATLSNDLLLEAIYSIAKKARNINVDCVVAIERGGLPLATFLSAYLNVPLERIKVSFYNGMIKQKEPIVDLKEYDSSFYKNPMFVDDLVDSGDTMNYVKKEFPNSSFVTIYASKNKSDIYHFDKDPSEWIIFPWDTEDDGFNYDFAEYGWWKKLST